MNKIRQNVFPLLAALIWGAAFSSQAICSDRGMGAFTFNMLRGFVAFLALLIIAVIFTRKSIKTKNRLLGRFCLFNNYLIMNGEP